MAVRRNGIWNNPEIGQAFENLSGLFGAPKGTDVYAYAKARQTVDQTQRLAELFRMSQDPNFDQKRFDRGNIANQSYVPTQSYYAVDSTAATSRANNAADNARALEAQRMDDETKIKTTGLTNDSAERRNVYTTDSQGQVSRANNTADNARALEAERMKQDELRYQFTNGDLTTKPGETTIVNPTRQAALNLPEPTVRGNIDLKQGETVVTPNNQIFQGQAKPLSYDEWKAREAAAGTARGDINPVDVLLGQQTPVKVADPASPSGARFASPGEAARTGAAAFVDPGQAGSRKDAVAVINGRQIPVTRGPTDTVWKTQDGQPIPGDVPVMQLPQAKGSVGDIGVAPTQTNLTKATDIESTITAAEDQLNGVEKLLKEQPGIAGAPGSIQGILQDVTATAREFTKAFGDKAAAVVDPSKLDEYANRISPDGARNPYIHEFNTRMLGLAYQHAKLNNPSGEVSRQALQASLQALGSQGIFSNNQSAREGLNGFRSQIQSAKLQIQNLRKPGMGGAPAPAAPSGGRLRFDANGNPIQ